MFEKFGEFDSWEEINRAVRAQKEEGDYEAVKALALENGFDEADVEDYLDGLVEEFCTPVTAAIAKLEAESKELKAEGIIADYAKELQEVAIENKEFALCIRKKGKSLAKVIAKYIDYSFENRITVSKDITNLCNGKVKTALGNHDLTCGEPDRIARKKIYMAYYLGEKE